MLSSRFYTSLRQFKSTLCRGSILGIASLDNAHDLVPMARKVRKHCHALLEECLQAGSIKELLITMDEISNNLCSAMDLANCVRAIHPHVHCRRMASKMLALLQPVLVNMNTHVGLYRKLTELSSWDGGEPLSDELDAMKRSFLYDFSTLGAASGRVDKVGEQWQKIDHLSRIFEASCKNGDTESSLQLLDNLLKARHQLAVLCGHDSYADLTLTDRHFPTTTTILEWLRKSNAIHKDDHTKSVCEDQFPTFSLDQLVGGFEEMIRNELGLTLTASPCHFNWGFELIKMDIHRNNQSQGTIYLDVCKRSNKSNEAIHFTIRASKKHTTTNIVHQINRGQQTACSLISANLENLLQIPFYSAQSIFHELGHALHSVLSDTEYQSLSGTRCSLEVAEFPSTFLELMFEQPEVQRKYFNCTKKQVFFDTLQHIGDKHHQEITALGIIDILLHSKESAGVDWIKGLLSGASGIASHQTHISSLRHLGSYGSSFYTYSLNRSLAKAFTKSHQKWTAYAKLLRMGGLLSVEAIHGHATLAGQHTPEPPLHQSSMAQVM